LSSVILVFENCKGSDLFKFIDRGTEGAWMGHQTAAAGISAGRLESETPCSQQGGTYSASAL
jgi:hypothetical protein